MCDHAYIHTSRSEDVKDKIRHGPIWTKSSADERNIRTYIRIYILTYIHPLGDQCEWRRMTRMTGPDCAVILVHTYIHKYIE